MSEGLDAYQALNIVMYYRDADGELVWHNYDYFAEEANDHHFFVGRCYTCSNARRLSS